MTWDMRTIYRLQDETLIVTMTEGIWNDGCISQSSRENFMKACSPTFFQLSQPFYNGNEMMKSDTVEISEIQALFI